MSTDHSEPAREGRGRVGAEDFATFFRREFPKVVTYLYACGFVRHAEDAAEEAMHAAYNKWDGIEKPEGWVRVVALRCAQRQAVSEQLRNKRDGYYAVMAPPSSAPVPAEIAEITEEQRAVLGVIESLPLARRRIVALAFDGWKVREIAEELGIAEATVRSHLRHVRRSLSERALPTGGAV